MLQSVVHRYQQDQQALRVLAQQYYENDQRQLDERSRRKHSSISIETQYASTYSSRRNLARASLMRQKRYHNIRKRSDNLSEWLMRRKKTSNSSSAVIAKVSQCSPNTSAADPPTNAPIERAHSRRRKFGAQLSQTFQAPESIPTKSQKELTKNLSSPYSITGIFSGEYTPSADDIVQVQKRYSIKKPFRYSLKHHDCSEVVPPKTETTNNKMHLYDINEIIENIEQQFTRATKHSGISIHSVGRRPLLLLLQTLSNQRKNRENEDEKIGLSSGSTSTTEIATKFDHLTARWDGLPSGGGGTLLGDDGGDDGTTISDTSKQDFADVNCLRRSANRFLAKACKYTKILTPHVILVSILIAYLCFGAWILMILETKTELMARSRKLIRLSNLMTNFSAESWKTVNSIQTGEKPPIGEEEWIRNFREYMMRVSETIDDRRPIRREIRAPDMLVNLHNKWTFPTALLYVLTVLTTCGYGEVSVDTDTGKIFSVAFALIGIPLMFITAADIGKFLSETLLKLVKKWNIFVTCFKQTISELFCGYKKFERRKSLQSAAGHQFETLGLLGAGLEGTGAEANLWFPIGAYVSCICLYCSMGSAMFINWERHWSFIHAFHFGFNLIVTVGLGDIVVTDYVFLSLIVAFVIVGLSVVTMCVDLASTHLKAYFTRIHYFGRARRFLELSDELREIVALLGAMRKKKHGKVTWNDLKDFLDNELCDRPFEPHELLMKLRFIDETTSSAMSTLRHNSLQSDMIRDAEYLKRLNALRPENNGGAAYL